jgi:NADPH:quinone reductase-like Zn-dependent oxidoreductase
MQRPPPAAGLQILGGDLAGVVVQAPEGSSFKPGDRVFGCTGMQGEVRNSAGQAGTPRPGR